MRVLLIQSYLGKDQALVVPLGLAYIVKALRKEKIEAELLDLNLYAAPFKVLAGKLKEKEYDYIGVSLRNIDTLVWNDFHYYYRYLAPTLRLIQHFGAGAGILAGGAGFSIFPLKIMSAHRAIDYGFAGESLSALCRFLGGATPGELGGVYYRENRKILLSGPPAPQDFNLLEENPWEVVDVRAYSRSSYAFGIISKSGCCFKCIYCPYPALGGDKMLIRPPERILNDIKVLGEQHGINAFSFIDSIFNYPPAHAETICRGMLASGLKCSWTAGFTVKGFSREFAGLAEQAGCVFFSFSPDGFSPRTLRDMGKSITTGELDSCLGIFEGRPDTPVMFNFFISGVNMGLRDYLALLKYCRRIRQSQHMHLGLWVPRILPGTPLHSRLIRDSVPLPDLLPAAGEIRPDELFCYAPGNFLHKNLCSYLDRKFLRKSQSRLLSREEKGRTHTL